MATGGLHLGVHARCGRDLTRHGGIGSTGEEGFRVYRWVALWETLDSLLRMVLREVPLHNCFSGPRNYNPGCKLCGFRAENEPGNWTYLWIDP